MLQGRMTANGWLHKIQPFAVTQPTIHIQGRIKSPQREPVTQTPMHQTLTSMDGPLLGRVNYIKELIINHFRITIVVSYYFQKRNARVDVPQLI